MNSVHAKLHHRLEDRLGEMEIGLSRHLGQHSLGIVGDNEFFRTTACGLAAEITSRELSNLGYPNKLLLGNIRHPDSLGPKKPSGEHVICLAAGEGREYVVDANYSQFFAPFGLDSFMMRYQNDRLFPEEKVMVFTPDETNEVAEWCAEYVTHFWRNNLYSPGFQKRHGYKDEEESGGNAGFKYLARPITRISYSDLVGYFKNLWDLANYREYQSPDDVARWAEDYHRDYVDNRGVSL